MKKVIKNYDKNTVRIADCDHRMIHACIAGGIIYKLQCIDLKWMFCEIDSQAGCTGTHPSMIEAIESQILGCPDDDVLEFGSKNEFKEWLKENL